MNAESVKYELESLICASGCGLVDRVVVLEDAGSTQDEAGERCGGRPGLLLLAINQFAGRGRLGRQWTNTSGMGLAATFVLPGDLDPGRLSITAGLAACLTCEAAIAPRTSNTSAASRFSEVDREFHKRLGLRWPNDVVEADGLGRKLAGVLVEKSQRLNLVGIGINVGHRSKDWPVDLAARAVSLAQLGSSFTISSTAAWLAGSLDQVLRSSNETILKDWHLRNVLRGRSCTFEHNGERFSGLVQEIEPTSHIEIIERDGRSVRLPALTTSLVHQ